MRGSKPQPNQCPPVQTAAQGRRGRSWAGHLDDNLYFSFVWAVGGEPMDMLRQLQKLNLAISVAVALAAQAQGAIPRAPIVPFVSVWAWGRGPC